MPLAAMVARAAGGVNARGRAAVCAASGHAAQFLAFFTLLEPGDEFLASKNLYGGSITQFTRSFPRLGWTGRLVDPVRPENFREALTERTKAIFVESLANPGGVDWSFKSQSGTGEYFLIENRQLTGYDGALPGCGVLIWHVNEAVTSGSSANADENNRLISLEEADGFFDLDLKANKGDAGDPYPGKQHVTSISNSTSPSTKLLDGSNSGVSVSVPDVACSSTANITVTSPAIATTGFIRATTNPALAADIIVDGVERDSWGLNWVPYPTGPHEVCFDAVLGFVAPACQSVEVLDGQTTTVQGTYTQNGYLRVLSSPALPTTILVDGVARNEWGMWSGVPAGTYHVCFGAVEGYDVPACRDVVVTAGQTASTTGTFTSNPSAPGPSQDVVSTRTSSGPTN